MSHVVAITAALMPLRGLTRREISSSTSVYRFSSLLWFCGYSSLHQDCQLSETDSNAADASLIEIPNLTKPHTQRRPCLRRHREIVMWESCGRSTATHVTRASRRHFLKFAGIAVASL